MEVLVWVFISFFSKFALGYALFTNVVIYLLIFALLFGKKKILYLRQSPECSLVQVWLRVKYHAFWYEGTISDDHQPKHSSCFASPLWVIIQEFSIVIHVKNVLLEINISSTQLYFLRSFFDKVFDSLSISSQSKYSLAFFGTAVLNQNPSLDSYHIQKVKNIFLPLYYVGELPFYESNARI